MANTFVYVDGLNLYYRTLRRSPHKWLNIAALSAAVLPDTVDVRRINYYTARVSGRLDPDAPRRQHAYLRALGTLPMVHIHYGRFLVHKRWAGLAPPKPMILPEPDVAWIWKTEEKGSDVNLGVHLVRDAFEAAFEEAAVLTNDTDLCEAIRIVRDDVGLPVTLLSPVAQSAASLVASATRVRHVRPYVGPCQLPNPVIDARGQEIRKPDTW